MGVMRRSSPAISDIHIQRIREISQDFDMGQRNFVLTCLESFQVRNLSLDTDFRHLEIRRLLYRFSSSVRVLIAEQKVVVFRSYIKP